MYGYPDYRGFRVEKLDIHGDRQLSEFLQQEVSRYYVNDYPLVDRLRARLAPGTTILTAHRGSLRIVVAERAPMTAYDRLLDEIDELTDPRCLRQVEALN